MALARIAPALLFAFVGCSEPKADAPKPDETKSTAAPEVEPPGEFDPCEGKECFTVPEGIAGLAFGSSEQAVRDRFGKTRKKKLPARRVVASPECADKLRPPETRFIAKTEIGGEKAECEVDVVPDDGIARIFCELNGKRDRDEHAETANVLYRSLAKQYGEPKTKSEALVARGRIDALWSSDAAELKLTARRRGSRSRISLENISVKLAMAHAKQVSDLSAECDAKKAARDAKKAEREAALRDKARKFEEDLRPPLEKQ